MNLNRASYHSQARHDYKFVARDLDIEVLQIVLTRPFDDDGIIHKKRIIASTAHS